MVWVVVCVVLFAGCCYGFYNSLKKRKDITINTVSYERNFKQAVQNELSGKQAQNSKSIFAVYTKGIRDAFSAKYNAMEQQTFYATVFDDVNEKIYLFKQDVKNLDAAYPSQGIMQKDSVEYANIRKVHLKLNGADVSSGATGAAILGGMFFGAAGAVIGSTAPTTTKQAVQSIVVQLYTDDMNNPLKELVIFNQDSPMPAENYNTKEAIRQGDEIMARLDIIVDKNKG